MLMVGKCFENEKHFMVQDENMISIKQLLKLSFDLDTFHSGSSIIDVFH